MVNLGGASLGLSQNVELGRERGGKRKIESIRDELVIRELWLKGSRKTCLTW